MAELIENPRAIPLQIRGIGPETYFKLSRPWFTEHRFDTVFDVGANTGQFAASVATVLPSARIFSMEPLPGAFKALSARSRRYPNVRAFQCGVGRSRGKATIYENPYSDSSSFRPMNQLHRDQFPFTNGPVVPHEVEIRTLDDIAEEVGFGGSMVVKVDVQGFEDEVIRGGMKTFARAKMVIIEVSFAVLYDGAPSFDAVNDMLRSCGLRFSGCVDQLIGPVDGKILQGDALFLRAES